MGAAPLIPAADQWGPFARGLDPAEQRARLRSLRQTARLLIGPRGAEFCHWLAKAEKDPAAFEPACRALNALAANDRRQVLASYAALTRPAA